MSKYILLLTTLALTACATPTYVLENSKGQTVVCGGNTTSSILLGRIGYELQKSADAKCVKEMQEKGFKPL